jgi:hypothetical protein
MPRLFNREHHWIQHLDAFASNPCEKLGLGGHNVGHHHREAATPEGSGA